MKYEFYGIVVCQVLELEVLEFYVYLYKNKRIPTDHNYNSHLFEQHLTNTVQSTFS